MEGFSNKPKMKFLCLELLGMTLLTIAFNFQSEFYAYFIMIVSLWSWNVSACHFNPTVTLASYFFRGEYRSDLGTMILILITQFIGTLAGLLITFVTTKKLYPTDTTKVFEPAVRPLCPKLAANSQPT